LISLIENIIARATSMTREQIAENLRRVEQAVEDYENDPRAADPEYFESLTALRGKLQRELEQFGR
jgi:predicted DNA-binding protein YlxM (UPF0122 family)